MPTDEIVDLTGNEKNWENAILLETKGGKD
jgi:hypothetical protein